MNDRLIPFGPGAQLFILVYLLSLLVVGAIALRAQRDSSMLDFYLAGKGVGFVTLLLTLYATQYSGNTLFGFTGATYRTGYRWTVCVHFMTSIVVVYLAFAPQLFRLAKQHQFITPSDYLDYRFGNAALSLITSVLMVGAISNYLLAQLMAMGKALEGLTDADPVQAYRAGVVVLALVIVVYESMGGFRAVAWTDVIQGTVLAIGFIVLLWAVYSEFGSIQQATARLAADAPEKTDLPNGNQLRTWFSYVVMVGFGGALYPQSIQRIYAAKSSVTLQRSLQVMAFMPLTTTLVAVIVGIYGAAYFPGLRDDQADTILTVICRQIQQGSNLGYWLVVVLFSAVLAAIMSTADSVLLTISSMVTKDVYAKYWAKELTQRQLTWFGKLVSWVLMVALVIAALNLRGKTLVELLDYKFDLLVQMAPAFILSLHWRRQAAWPTLGGMVLGVALSVGFVALGYEKIYGLHAGLVAVLANLAVVVAGSWWFPEASPSASDGRRLRVSPDTT